MFEGSPCFISMTIKDIYLRIEYNSPLGDMQMIRRCIIEWSILCKEYQREALLLVRNPNGMHSYTIFDLREISDFYKEFFSNIIIAIVDPAVNINVVFVTAVNKANDVITEFFNDEADAIDWIRRMKSGDRYSAEETRSTC